MLIWICFALCCQMLKAYVWLQTSDDSIQEVEQEVAMFCPFICREIHSGMGSSKNYPISLPPRVNPPILSLILDYCRFHQVPGRSNKERKYFDEKFVRMDTKRLCELTSAADSLQLKPLVDLTSRALARVIEGRSPEEIREIFHLPDDLTENIEVEEDHSDERSVDDLLSFINGGNEDSKGTRNSKNKKKNRKRKEDHKTVPSNCIGTSNSTSSSGNAVDINKKESNELDYVRSSSPMAHVNLLPEICDATKLLDVEDDRFAPEDEFDDCDLDDDDIDPALKEKIDREVEDFARRLNSDWPERMQEILSLGQESRSIQLTTNGNGSMKRF
ncbi:hypothetical protein BUALT_Bualt19G0009400 [Buddleja alternifolia]|uniref:SKP1-like protein 21 n=1 Tax=Buddleja alternifolia TaxID=168488 RepID=A0AAV6W0N3_9LAMI|nr:hypothetical protein BUALT_Bualt19G0009400 [Buddleja alternifolia]